MKKLKMMIVAVVAALMLAGCTVSAPGFEAVGSVPTGTITALETMPATAPEETRYQFGDIVWVLETELDGSVSPSRYAVVERTGDTVTVTGAISDSAEALRKCLPEYLESGYADMWVIDANECYSSEAAAQEAADELMSGR